MPVELAESQLAAGYRGVCAATILRFGIIYGPRAANWSAVVVSFTSAGAVLIISSQIPSLLGTEGGSGNPVLTALRAIASPGEWSLTDVAVGVGAMAIMLGGRRISGLFPGALVAVVAGSLWSWATDYDGSVVGDIEVELVVRTDLPETALDHLIGSRIDDGDDRCRVVHGHHRPAVGSPGDAGGLVLDLHLQRRPAGRRARPGAGRRWSGTASRRPWGRRSSSRFRRRHNR